MIPTAASPGSTSGKAADWNRPRPVRILILNLFAPIVIASNATPLVSVVEKGRIALVGLDFTQLVE